MTAGISRRGIRSSLVLQPADTESLADKTAGFQVCKAPSQSIEFSNLHGGHCSISQIGAREDFAILSDLEHFEFCL